MKLTKDKKKRDLKLSRLKGEMTGLLAQYAGPQVIIFCQDNSAPGEELQELRRVRRIGFYVKRIKRPFFRNIFEVHPLLTQLYFQNMVTIYGKLEKKKDFLQLQIVLGTLAEGKKTSVLGIVFQNEKRGKFYLLPEMESIMNYYGNNPTEGGEFFLAYLMGLVHMNINLFLMNFSYLGGMNLLTLLEIRKIAFSDAHS